MASKPTQPEKAKIADGNKPFQSPKDFTKWLANGITKVVKPCSSPQEFAQLLRKVAAKLAIGKPDGYTRALAWKGYVTTFHGDHSMAVDRSVDLLTGIQRWEGRWIPDSELPQDILEVTGLCQTARPILDVCMEAECVTVTRTVSYSLQRKSTS